MPVSRANRLSAVRSPARMARAEPAIVASVVPASKRSPSRTFTSIVSVGSSSRNAHSAGSMPASVPARRATIAAVA